LLNLSAGAHVCDAIDSGKPTVVVTHGWNPLPKLIHSTFGESAAHSIRCRFGDQVNVLSWDWNAVRISALHDDPFEIASMQGKQLAAALRGRGVNPSQTHFIGHSLGSIVVTQAAYCLGDLGATRQLTLLDPPTTFHAQIFDDLGATRHACFVENYWAPGISGYGKAVSTPGVHNYRVEGEHPCWGIIDLSVSNHVNVMAWYAQTMQCPQTNAGFQRSFVVECAASLDANANVARRKFDL
jgi:pimeloyl-ACP methyl ester carboxylesterase